MLKGFRDFVLRGNVLDLAVGVIIGGAFGTVVTSRSRMCSPRSSAIWLVSRTSVAISTTTS